MSKRKVGRAGQKRAAERKRGALRDLRARESRDVVGGLLPAVQAAPEAPSRAPGSTNFPTETVKFTYPGR